jgi:hypothetical protein
VQILVLFTWSLWTDIIRVAGVTCVPLSTSYVSLPPRVFLHYAEEASNQSGTDDLLQRAYILATSLLLLGYTAQAAGMEIEHFTNEETGHTSLEISEDGFHALQAAAAFFLIAKLLRLFLYLWYAYYLPKFRTSHCLQALFSTLSCCLFIPLFFAHSTSLAVVLPALAMLLDILCKYVMGVAIHWFGDHHRTGQIFIPALSIEHLIERTTAFVVVRYSSLSQRGDLNANVSHPSLSRERCLSTSRLLLPISRLA